MKRIIISFVLKVLFPVLLWILTYAAYMLIILAIISSNVLSFILILIGAVIACAIGYKILDKVSNNFVDDIL